MRIGLLTLVLAGAAVAPLMAGIGAVPEIDTYSATAAISVIGGAVLLLRNRKKK